MLEFLIVVTWTFYSESYENKISFWSNSKNHIICLHIERRVVTCAGAVYSAMLDWPLGAIICDLHGMAQ